MDGVLQDRMSGAPDTWTSNDCLPGDGEMATLMRALDWSQTAVGPVDSWPQSLCTAVSICLGSRFPIILWWGREYTQFYNDAYLPVLGVTKHPQFLGRSGKECWADVWDVIGPMLESVFATGEATWSEDLQLAMTRNAYIEETYFTFSYSPIRGGGRVTGIFCAVEETTERVLGERRLRTLRDLAANAGAAKTVEEACEMAAVTLAANPADLPFALLYLLDDDGEQARLAGAAGLSPDTPASPRRSPAGDTAAGGWPFGLVLQTRQTIAVDDVVARFGPLPGGPWPESPEIALVLPITSPLQVRPVGFLVAGISPRRALDGAYRDFLQLVAGQISAAIADARAYEQERQRAEALAELDRAKTAFFSNVSHEFRTPLTLMLGPAEDALADTAAPLPPAQRERIEVVHRNGLRLLRLVNTLLDFSRLEAGRTEPSFEPLDLSSFTVELASVFRSAIERAGLHLAVDCPPLEEPIYVDREMWEKIVLNLLSNALKFTFNGEIGISLRPAGDRIELQVRDTGTGIAQEELPHLFERFHRIRGARARTQEGSGIGLALVSELVHLHSGSVAVESVIGVGTTFTVSIPTGTAHLPAGRIGAARTLTSTASGAAPFVEEALRWLPDGSASQAAISTGDALPPPETVPAVRETAASARILVADDNADMRDYLRRLLEQRWTVEAVGDGRTALTAARERPPDLVLSDVMMPGLDGFELLQALRADPRTRAIPVVLLSARAGEEARVEGMEAGADDYLIKPFSARELMARIGGHLQLARLRQAAARQEHALRLEAEAALRVRDEIVSFASHDLRTPLATIRGFAQLLQRQVRRQDVGAIPALAESLDGIVSASARMQTLIDEVLDTVRLQSGQPLELNREPVDLVALVRGSVEEQQKTTPRHELRLEANVPKLIGMFDAVRLERVLSNLLSNAIKYSPAGGPIAVTIRQERRGEEGWATIEVRDTGLGIPDADLPHMFERFYRGGNVVGQIAGSGIGLAGSKQIVEQHGGTIGVASAEGRGSVFTVRLPLAGPASV